MSLWRAGPRAVWSSYGVLCRPTHAEALALREKAGPVGCMDVDRAPIRTRDGAWRANFGGLY